jgi:hypothetical protein
VNAPEDFATWLEELARDGPASCPQDRLVADLLAQQIRLLNPSVPPTANRE